MYGVPCVFAAVMHGHDVRMVERRGRACLHIEAHPVIGLRGEHRVQQLDRDRTVEPDVPAVADLRHAAAPQNPRSS